MTEFRRSSSTVYKVKKHPRMKIDAAVTLVVVKDFFHAFPLFLPYGLTCLVAHITLWAIFRFGFILPSRRVVGPWNEAPSFTAHQIIALVLMATWTIHGFDEYYRHTTINHENDHDINNNTYHINDHNQTTSTLRVLQVLPGGLIMAQKSMAALWIWDLPVMTWWMEGSHDKTSDMIMHIHHVGMLILTCIVLGLLSFDNNNDNNHDSDQHLDKNNDETPFPYGRPICSCYAPIFLGMVELSSIPLQVVDLFHPHKGKGAWYRYLQSKPPGHPLHTLNEVSRQAFAALFLLVRGILFPYIIDTDVIPNVSLAIRELYPTYRLPLGIVLVFSIGFTILQLYWGVLVARQIVKALSPSKEGDDNKVDKKD